MCLTIVVFCQQTPARRARRQNQGRQRRRIDRISHSTCIHVHRITQSGIAWTVPRVSLLKLSTPFCITVCKYEFIVYPFKLYHIHRYIYHRLMTNSRYTAWQFHSWIFLSENSLHTAVYSLESLNVLIYAGARTEKELWVGPSNTLLCNATLNNRGGSKQKNHQGTWLLLSICSFVSFRC